MKKFFLSNLIVLLAINSLADCPQNYVDTIPVPRYITNISLSINDNESGMDILRFEDTFRNDLSLDRTYNIYVMDRHNTDLTTGCKFRYVTPETEPMDNMHWYNYDYFNEILLLSNTIVKKNSTGITKQETKNINHIISSCIEQGVRDIIIFINPLYPETNSVTGESKNVSYYGSSGIKNRLYNINYLTFRLPAITHMRFTAPINDVNYNEEFELDAKIQAMDQTTYKMQECISNQWQTILSGTISTADARIGKTIHYKKAFSENGYEGKRAYRLIATDAASGESDTSATRQVVFKYPWTFNGKTEYYPAGTKITLPKPADCMEYKINSDRPVAQVKKGDYIEYTMPSSQVQIDYQESKYTVRFLNADYTVLKTEEVECGADATAPADPTMEGVVFDKWSADFTNVHRNLNVYARYTMDGNYVFETSQSEHRNHVHPMDGFTQSTTRAMCGDTIVFQASVRTPQVATLRYETCYQNQDGTWTQWNAPTDNTVGSYSADDVTDGQTKEFSIAIPVAYQSNQVRQRSYGFAFRFYVTCAGSSIYSEPFEYDVYYPITIQSKIGIADGLTESLFVENSDGDFNMGELVTLPVRYEDTVRLYRLNGGTGACMNYTPAVGGGVDKEGIAYFICPGDVETVQVGVNTTAVVFEVTGQGKAEYKSYGNNAYYVEQVSCGGSVQHMPADPEEANAIFKGWKSWNASDYPDDAYLNVPTGQTMIGFTADFEDIPPVPQYTVKFFGKDSASQIGTDQTVNEGENATPPEATEISGFHFVGWNKPYTTITANTEIVALYGENNKKWGVKYKNWDGSDLGTDSVYDGEAAQGVIAIREGYSFTGWIDAVSGKAADLSHVMADRTVKATFEEAIYVITYAYRANPELPLIEIAKENVRHGTMPELWSTIEPAIRAEFEAELGGWQYEIGSIQWTPTIVAATKDATYELFYSVSLRKYTVRFQNWDHSEIETQQVEYGKAAVAPAKRPRRAGYTFIGWDREFDNVIAHMIVTAQFKLGEDPNPETYKVTLIAEHGSINVVENGMDLNAVEANTVLHFTATPDEGYTFKEWKGYNAETGLTVTADTTVEAIFEPVASGMEEVLPPNKSQVRKEIVDGVLYIILPNERRFSTDGQER